MFRYERENSKKYLTQFLMIKKIITLKYLYTERITLIKISNGSVKNFRVYS